MVRPLVDPNIPPLESDWTIGRMLSKECGGDYRTWNKYMGEIAEERSQKIAADSRVALERARIIVAKDYAGLRQTRSNNDSISQAVSPQAKADLFAKFPKIEPGWMTGNMIAEQFGGDYRVWRRAIHNYAKIRVKKLVVSKELPQDKAELEVHIGWAGIRRLPKGPPTLAASPELLELMLADLLPAKSADWMTGRNFHDEYGGSDTRWNKRIEALALELRQDIQRKLKVPQEEAEAIVDHNLIGWRWLSGNGKPALCCSIDARDLLVSKYPRQLKAEWRNGNMMEKNTAVSAKPGIC